MPELPDVESHRRLLARHAEGRAVRRVHVPDPELLAGTTPQGLGRALHERCLAPPRRHGKWLIAPTERDGPSVVMHFRMTGRLVWSRSAADRTERDGVVIVLDEGEVRYRTVRRMGRVHLVPGGADPARVTGPLGPDAHGLDLQTLGERLEGRRGRLKSALMDQELIAGLGNELVDEILWRAGLHPRTAVADLDDETRRRLHEVMQDVLDRSVRAGHVPSGRGWLNGRRDAEEPACPRCGTPLVRERVAGRTTYWCPTAQER